MAYPTIAATNTSSNNSGSPHTVNLPAGIAVGDLLLIFFSCSGTITTPTGWTQLSNTVNGTVRLGIYYRIADGTEGTTVSVTVGSTLSAHATARVTGWHGTTPPEVGVAVSATTLTPDPPSLTASWGSDTNLFLAITGWSTTNTLSAYPTNYTSDQTTKQITSGSNGEAVAFASFGVTGATENPGTYTLAGTANRTVAQTLVIRPALDDNSSSSSTSSLSSSSSSTSSQSSSSTSSLSSQSSSSSSSASSQSDNSSSSSSSLSSSSTSSLSSESSSSTSSASSSSSSSTSSLSSSSTSSLSSQSSQSSSSTSSLSSSSSSTSTLSSSSSSTSSVQCPLLASLKAYWALDEVSGTRFDSRGTTNLRDVNTVGSAAGVISNAATFAAASSEQLTVSDNPEVSTGDIDFSLQAWVKLSSKSADAAIVSMWEVGASKEYLLYYDHTADRFKFSVSSNGLSATGTISADTLGSPALSTWYLVHAWHDSVNNQLAIAVDAGSADTVAYSSGVLSSQTSFSLGGTSGIGFFDGALDEVGIWKRVLTSTERTSLYNSGSGLAFASFCDENSSSSSTSSLSSSTSSSASSLSSSSTSSLSSESSSSTSSLSSLSSSSSSSLSSQSSSQSSSSSSESSSQSSSSSSTSSLSSLSSSSSSTSSLSSESSSSSSTSSTSTLSSSSSSSGAPLLPATAGTLRTGPDSVGITAIGPRSTGITLQGAHSAGVQYSGPSSAGVVRVGANSTGARRST